MTVSNITFSPTVITSGRWSSSAQGGGGGGGTLIARADWSLHGVTPTTLAGYEDVTWFEYNGVCAKVGDELVMTYPDSTGTQINAGLACFVDSRNLQEVYIEFTVRLPDANPQGAIKFCKITGVNSAPAGYSNTTYQLESNKSFGHISFGDGTTDGNDVAQVIYYNGSNPTFTGRNFGVAAIDLPQRSAGLGGTGLAPFIFDTANHTVKIKHRYNSGTTLGTETNDGEYFVQVDEDVYLDGTLIFNRHYTNSLYIEQINFGGVIQDSPPLRLIFSDIKISTGGFM